jgi:hypothetical protein
MVLQQHRCCGYLDDTEALWKRRLCLEAVSKDVRGELHLLDRERQECEEPRCATLKTDHLLKVEVRSHEPCDSDLGRRLDGVLYVRRLTSALSDGTGEGRGLHTGAFGWVGDGVRIDGRLAGMTNAGTHRQPMFDPCQECRAPGYLEGRLCGRIVEAKDGRLVGCQVVAAYRLRFDPSAGFGDTGIEGTIEGLVACSCDGRGGCLDLTALPAAAHPNPWTIGGWELHVFDHGGAPAATADVVTWGGSTGLNAGFETRITLAAPATGVDLTAVHFASPATVKALDGAGGTVDSATMTVAGSPETLHLNGAGIVTLVVTPPQDETLILEICAHR